jgi:hypothetical protein
MALIQAWHQRQPYAGRTFWFKATLEQAVAHGEMVGKAVRSFEPKWRAGEGETGNSYVIVGAISF